MIITLISAMDKNQLIGADNSMPWHLPADFKFFKEVTTGKPFKFFKSITMGKPVVMGRKTFESIGRALPGRQNVVISRNGFTAEGITSVNSIESALKSVGDVDEAMIIGGANIYQQMIEEADCMYLTHVEAECKGDAWFPKFDMNDWNIIPQESFEADEKNNFNFKIVKYLRK